MERRQLMARLELMKKELEKKQRKLEKAKRAARVKAHVKQKIQELNLQASKETISTTHFVSCSSNTDSNEEKQLEAPTALEEKEWSNSEASAKTSSIGKGSPVKPMNAVEDPHVKTKSSEDVIKKAFRSPTKEKLQFPATVSHTVDNHGGKEACVRQGQIAVLETEDSLAITPTFRSMRDTDAGLTGLQTLPLLGRFTDLDSCADSLTLNLHTEGSLCSIERVQDFLDYTVTPVVKNINTSSETTSATDASNIKSQAEKFAETQTGRSLREIEVPAQNIETGDREDRLKRNDCSEQNNCVAINPTCTQSVGESAPVPGCDKNKPALKLQDIGSTEDTALKISSQSLTPQSEQSYPLCDPFLDYTELDAIPYSQFELTEDFLSEASHSDLSSSQRQGRRRSLSALVQRKSPRLSTFDFESSEKVASGCLSSYMYGSQQSSLLKLVRKQKKTKKALLLSSLFQYLIDEAKRDTSFVEFKLPDDVAQLASCRQKDKGPHKQPEDLETLPHTSAEHNTADCPDIEIIPETEVDPELTSQTFKDSDIELNSKFTDSQTAKIEECEVRDSCDVNTETVAVESKEIKPRPEIECKTMPQPGNKLLNAAVNLSVASDPSNPFSVSQHNNSESTKTRSDSGPLPSCEESGQQLVTGATNPKSPVKEANKRKSHKKKGGLSLKKGAVTEKTVDNCSNSWQKGKPDCEESVSVRLQHESQNEGQTQNVPAVSTTSLEQSSVTNLLSTPKTLTCEQTSCMDILSSPVLFGTQSQSNKENEIKEKNSNSQTDTGDQEPIDHSVSKHREQTCKPVFTPSKSKCGDEHTPTADKEASCSWITYAGCAESGCRDAVIDVVVGTATSDSEETTFILSVQTTALTLWTLDDQQEWSAEFYWYLPQTNETEGACRIHTTDEHLAVLVWGVDGVSKSPFLMVFVYHWDSQHTQRFSLPLPSPVLPQRIFCLGLELSVNMVLVFSTDKVYTRGKKFTVDMCQSCVSSEINMEETNTPLLDLLLVENLPDAVIGLAADHRILVWNHKRGSLILTMTLPDSVPIFSRMFTCCFLKGYLLLHMVETEGSEVCLMAVNPTAATGKVVRRFMPHTEELAHWKQVSVHQDLLLALSTEGKLHIWDACSAKPLFSLDNHPCKVHIANIFGSKDACWLLTGQKDGCFHVHSVQEKF